MALNWSLKNGRFYLAPAIGNTFALNGISGSIELNETLYSIPSDAQQISDQESGLFQFRISVFYISLTVSVTNRR